MKTNKLILLISLLAFVLTVHVGCRKDTFVDEIIETPQSEVLKVVDMNGIIFDENDAPLENVEIQVGNRTSTTDANGVFLVRQVEISTFGTAVKASLESYFDLSRIVYPNSNKERIYVQLAMTPKGDATKFQAADGASITVNGGAKVVFSGNSIVDNSGTPYNGEVSVYTHWFDPSDINLAVNSPASLEGVDLEGENKILSTYGMMGVELETGSGEKLQLASDEQAELTFPIPSSIQGNAPETIPLWSLDEETGKWIEEFSAKKEGNNYVGSVNHFSFWNCDYPGDLVTISGMLESDTGIPLSNQVIYITQNGLVGGIGYTDNTGFFNGKIPKDQSFNMIIRECETDVADFQIGPFAVDTDLGTFTVSILSGTSTVSANLKGCVGEPLTGAYGLVNGYQLLSADDNGSVNGILTHCTNMTNQIKFYDGQALNVSDLIDLDFSLDENDLGDITVCEQLGEFVSFSVDGGDYWLIEDPEAFVVNSDEIVLIASNIAGSSFKFELPNSLALGTYEPTYVLAALPPDMDFPNGNYLQCSEENGWNIACDQFSVTITEFDLTSEMVSGTFEGNLLSAIDGGPAPSEMFVTGSFRSKIVDQFDEASVSGKVWVDLNANGTRDLDEEDQTVCSLIFFRQDVTTQSSFGTRSFRAEDGTYSFTGLQPGEYYLRYYSYNYQPTDYQIGDLEKNNDFYAPGGGVLDYYSYTFTVGDGENLENVDLGLAIPTEYNGGYILASGCEPDITLKNTPNSGLGPYDVALSDGQTGSFEKEITFTVLTGGNYTMTVTDALGNSATATREVLSYTNSIGGRIWEDAPGEIEGLFESLIDFDISGVEVGLYTSAGVLVKTVTSDGNSYRFDDLEFGDYYVEVVAPAGYSISDMHPDEYSGSNIDPATSRSGTINVVNCGEYHRRNCGFKAN